MPTSIKPYWLVVVWPNEQTAANPHGEYTENVIVHHQVRLQGVGAGGFDPDGTYVPGLDHRRRRLQPRQPERRRLDRPAQHAALQRPRGRAGRRGGDGAQRPGPGDTVPASYYPAIDGFTITGGSQSNFPASINEVNGGIKTPYGATARSSPRAAASTSTPASWTCASPTTSSGGNSGSYGGGIRVGTPYAGTTCATTASYIGHNQIRDNGGTNLAGGIGLFNGSDGYQVDHNAICGNFSAEYGGAITAFGYQAHRINDVANGASVGGRITDNRIWFNQSYDEGGGGDDRRRAAVRPDGALRGLRPGLIDANVIQTNLANDDGGGIRLLQTSGSHISRSRPDTITITNNTDHQQRLGPRGRRHRPRRRGLRRRHQQHGGPQPHHRHRDHERRPAGTGRPVDGGQQRPAHGPPRPAPRSGARSILGETTVQQADAAEQRLLGQPGRHLQRWLRLRHRRPAAGRHGQRRQHLGHGRGRRPDGGADRRWPRCSRRRRQVDVGDTNVVTDDPG